MVTIERPLIKKHLEDKFNSKGIDRKFRPDFPEPYPGANQEVREVLKENFEMKINPKVSTRYVEEIITKFYKDKGYMNISNLKDHIIDDRIIINNFLVDDGLGDLISVRITHEKTSGQLLVSTFYSP